MDLNRWQKTESYLKVLGNGVRLQVVDLLAKCEGELSVTGINQQIDLSQSALSQHLAILRRANIVKTRRVGTTILYSLQDAKHTMGVLACLS